MTIIIYVIERIVEYNNKLSLVFISMGFYKVFTPFEKKLLYLILYSSDLFMLLFLINPSVENFLALFFLKSADLLFQLKSPLSGSVTVMFVLT